MKNEQYIDLITAYLQGTITPEEHTELNRLIEQGEIDLLDIKEMEILCKRMDLLAVPEPGAELRKRFYAMLEAEKTSQKSSFSLSEWIDEVQELFTFRRLAYTLGIFLIGLLVGDLYAPISQQDEQINRLSSEVYQLREMMMISLLDNTSATERLKAVNISTEIRSTDKRMIEALLKTLNNDPNVNVRVAAVEALVRHGSNPAVREGLVNSILHQESPIVQAALADAMLVLQEERSVEEFKKLLEENGIDKNVRNKLENTIAALS